MGSINLNNDEIPFLAVPLPEDILKLKWAGEFEQADRVIDRRLKKELPEGLRKRLMLEKEMLKQVPGQYPYTWEKALQRMRDNIRDFREEELKELWEEDAADWIFIRGEVHFRDNFLENIVKTRGEYRKRILDPRLDGESVHGEILDRTIEEMRKNGHLAEEIRMKIRLRIKEEAERENARIRVYLPVPLEYEQIRNVRLTAVRIGGQPAKAEEYTLAPPDSEQRTVCMETVHRRGQEYEIQFSFENHMKYVDLSTSKALELAAGGEWEMGLGIHDPSHYLGERLPHIRFTPYIRGLAREIVGEEKNPLAKARKIYDFITTHVNYSYVRSYLTLENIPEEAAVSLKGDCGVQALLFIVLCRVSGIPARWQSGLFTAPHKVGCHDWAQFYIAPFGWLFADCSFGGSARRNHSDSRWNFYFGNLDPFRLPAAREFQADFVPASRFLRSDPYDNQTGEVEYEDRGLLRGEYETSFLIESISPLA